MQNIHRNLTIAMTVAGLAFAVPTAYAATDAYKALLAEAKVSEAQARETALDRVPDGSVQSAELEREHGRLIWSFDIARPSTKSISEVNVDARTGKVVQVKKESAAQEAREAKMEKVSPK